jgi:hypothetical protein
MSASRDTNARDSIATQFKALDRQTWQRSESALLGMIGEKNAKMPLLMPVDAFTARAVARKQPQGDDKMRKCINDSA